MPVNKVYYEIFQISFLAYSHSFLGCFSIVVHFTLVIFLLHRKTLLSQSLKKKSELGHRALSMLACGKIFCRTKTYICNCWPSRGSSVHILGFSLSWRCLKKSLWFKYSWFIAAYIAMNPIKGWQHYIIKCLFIMCDMLHVELSMCIYLIISIIITNYFFILYLKSTKVL